MGCTRLGILKSNNIGEELKNAAFINDYTLNPLLRVRRILMMTRVTETKNILQNETLVSPKS